MDAANGDAPSPSPSPPSSAPIPSPAPIPSANSPAPFLVKTYDMVDDPSTDKIVSWSATNNSFVVWDLPEFTKDLLPKYFKHNNFSSFVRQLNTYLWNGFRKVDSDRWEFANECFLRGQKHLLKSIIRRKPAQGHNQRPQQFNGQNSSVGPCVEVGKFGLEEEVEMLKRDKNVLMQELVSLRQQQQTTDNHLQAMVQRLQGMEQRQQQMMSFLAKAANSPGFLAQFVQQQNESSRRIPEGNKKRRLRQDGVTVDQSVGPTDGQIVKYQPLMNEAAKAMLRQIMKVEGAPRLETLDHGSDSYLISDVSPSPSNALDHGDSSTSSSGVTIHEVPPTSGRSYLPTTSASMHEIQSSTVPTTSFSVISPPIAAQELPSVSLPSNDITIPDLAENIGIHEQNFVGPETANGAIFDPNSLELGNFSPDTEIEWDESLLDDIFSTGPSWEQFLAPSPQTVDTEQMDSSHPAEEHSRENEAKPLENGLSKDQMSQLTKQMGLLTSDTEKA